MKKRVYFFALLLSVSCKKESSTVSKTVFSNTTLHSIKVNAYRNGAVESSSSFDLASNQSREVYTYSSRGIGSGQTYGGNLQPLDSFNVTFDNTYIIAHYKPNLIGSNPKKYLYASLRNLYNDNSYIANKTKDGKYRREWEFKYTFTEQDYLDAK